MSTTDKTEIYVTIAGERLQLILPGDGWTSDEAKLAKTVSEGMAPVTIEENLMLMDPDAWTAVLRVSYLRAGIEFPAQQVAKADMLDLMKAVADAVKEASKDLPPTKVSGNGDSEPAASSPSSENTPT